MAAFDIGIITYLTAAEVHPFLQILTFLVITIFFKSLADIVERFRFQQRKNSSISRMLDESSDRYCTNVYINEKILASDNMRENIRIIKFTATLSVVLMLLTYLITLNIENYFFQPNWWWLSHNFALTICGGLFVSFLTMLLCELRKYNASKINCEALMFQQALGLYFYLYLLHRNVEEYIDKSDAIIPEQFLCYHLKEIKQYMFAIQSIDYITFFENDALVEEHHTFCRGIKCWIAIEQMEGCLNVAICKARMKNLQENNIVKSKDIAKVLEAICRYIIRFLAQTEHYLEVVDKCCDNKFCWEEQKENIEKRYVSIFDIKAYDDFLKKSKE